MDFTLTTSGNVLYITPVNGLAYNTQYTVTLDSNISGYNPLNSGYYQLGSDYEFWFTGTYCPIFTTVGRIRIETGPIADNIIDDTIYRMILKNSQDAVEIISSLEGKRYNYAHWGCSWENVPWVMRRYVECKTAYDILALIELTNAGPGGASSQLKTLGDMTIRYGGPSAANQAIDPGRKKQLYDCWMEMLRGMKAVGINYAVRGWYDQSKGYNHPVLEPEHNRVIRPVDFSVADPHGPWYKARDWRGFYDYRRNLRLRGLL